MPRDRKSGQLGARDHKGLRPQIALTQARLLWARALDLGVASYRA
jgi:hypothetical protein